METREAIFKRRSCREYTDQKVSPEIIDELLHAAFSAPTAVRLPWKICCYVRQTGGLEVYGVESFL